MKKTLALMSLMVFLALQGCNLDECGSSKINFLKKYDALIAEVKSVNLSYTDPAWRSYDQRFDALVEDCYDRYEDEMTVKEIRNFWGKSIQYYYWRNGKSFTRALFDDKNPVAGKIRKHVRQLEKNPDKFLKDVLGQAGVDDLDDVLRDIGKEVEGLGKRLQEWLDN